MSQNLENTIVIKTNSVNGKDQKNRSLCKGIAENISCPFDNLTYNLTYGQYCICCLYMLFSDDPLMKTVFTKITELQIVNYICHKYKNLGKWYHNTIINSDEDIGSKRLIDLRIIFNNIMLCIEIDQGQHKNYKLINEMNRYKEFINEYHYKYIFIRYNPDKFKTTGIIYNPEKDLRYNILSNEIDKQIDLIKTNKIKNKIDIFYLFYDDYVLNNQIVINPIITVPALIEEKPEKCHNCPKCDKPFQFNCDLERHLERKISCAEDEKNKYHIDKKTCNFCNNVYSRPDSMRRHLETCQAKFDHDEKTRKEAEENQIIDKLMKELQQIKNDQQKKDKHIKKLLDDHNKKDIAMKQIIIDQKKKDKEMNKINKIKDKEINKKETHNRNDLSTLKEEVNILYIEPTKTLNNNNITNAIILNAYGNENISHITLDDYKQIINKKSDMLVCFIQYIHLNKNNPENHNIYIKNITHNFISVYDGKQWIIKDRNDMISKLIKDNINILTDKINEISKNLDAEYAISYNKILNDINFGKLKKELKFVLYNKTKVTKEDLGLTSDISQISDIQQPTIITKKKSILQELSA